jgi:hypothetical protein
MYTRLFVAFILGLITPALVWTEVPAVFANSEIEHKRVLVN